MGGSLSSDLAGTRGFCILKNIKLEARSVWCGVIDLRVWPWAVFMLRPWLNPTKEKKIGRGK